MIELYLLCALLITILLVINTNNLMRKKKQRTIRLAEVVQSLRSLLEYLAKHRGMTNAYLKGDHSFGSAITNLQVDIDKSFNHLIKNENNDSTLDNISEYLKMHEQWKTLKSKALKSQPAENFKKHVLLIEKIIENIAEEGLFIEVALSDNPNTKIITNTLVTELPHYVEILGQARGIGTGAIAQGGCTVDVKMNLKYLHDELESMIISLNKLKTVNTDKLSKNLDMNSLVANSVSAIQSFAKLLKDNLIDLKSPDISTDKLYTHGTEAITQSLNMFDTLYPLCLARIDVKL